MKNDELVAKTLSFLFSKFLPKGPTGGQQIKKPTPNKKRPPSGRALSISLSIGLPGMIRTCDLMVRSHALYPAGLRADLERNYSTHSS